VRDAAVREKGFQQYLSSKITAARRLIYDLAKPINGAGVDGLLKDFSGVPTNVSNTCLFESKIPWIDSLL
jgi:hypothetical protein